MILNDNVNQKTALVAVVAIAAVLAVSTIAIGHGRTAFASETTTISKQVNNTGVNVQTDTNSNLSNCWWNLWFLYRNVH